jgi:L-2-hydroxyglutarate oxidase LhgO
MENFDHCIIGAGVIGLATAYKLSQQFPHEKILLIETHDQFGSETSSRNSEVIHAGIYYPEKSLKAELCLKGNEQLYRFCQQYSVPHKRIGKLIIASHENDIAQLENIQKNALRNSVTLTLIDQIDCRKMEPNIQASAALYSTSTGIIDSHHYMHTLLTLAQQQGVLYSPRTRFINAEKTEKDFKVRLDTQDGEFAFTCQNLINSAGLHAPTVANNIDAMDAMDIPQYHYCRGHYFSYQGKAPFSHLIYPTPNKNTSGLGIHATLDLSGQVRFGPDTQFIDTIDYVWDEAIKSDFLQAIQQYYPTVNPDKLVPSYSGIRPKLTGPDEVAADFIIQSHQQHKIPGLINLFGIESPGLTASLAIADYIAEIINQT